MTMDWANRKLRILVVDDDVVSRMMLHEHLSAAGHEVTLAPSVREAKAALQRQAVQIIIADWLMPGATGLSCASGSAGARSPSRFTS